jgi:DNA-binding GntR family transcriptional regulator
VIEVTEMRAAMEGLALRHGFAQVGPADLAVARAAIAAGDAAADIQGLEVANRSFHRALTAPCRMPRLLAAIDDLHRASARILFATWRELAWQPRSDEEHRACLDAIERGQQTRAVRLLETHIREAGHALAEKLRTSRAGEAG